MKTLLQLLRVAFWLHPLQRTLTLVGAGIALTGLVNANWNMRSSLPGTTLPLMFLGFAVMLLLPLLLGGAWLRVLSAPRAMQLLPRARGRLLGGTLAILLAATLLWIFAYWWAFQSSPPRYRPGAEAYALMYMLTLTFATQCLIGAFIASRGPVWMLVVLGLWSAPHLLLPLFGFDDAARLLTGPVGIGMVLAAWLAFSIWYLRARQIGRQGWLRNVEATPASMDVQVRPLSRAVAMDRWLLGAGTPLSVGLQWTFGVALLLAVQLWLGLGRDGAARPVASLLFDTLSASGLVLGALSWGVATRSRALWLRAGETRMQLFSRGEGLMLRTALAVLLPLLLMGCIAWHWMPGAPAWPLPYVAGALLAPGLQAVWFGLALARRGGMFAAIAALLVIAGWYYGLVQPLAQARATPPWTVLALQLALVVALRFIAAHRWRHLDWPPGGRLALPG